MDELIRYLEKYQPVPQYAQIAEGGNWEEAIRVDLKSDSPNFISGNTDPSVAAEIFYRLNDGRSIFLGLRYSDSLKSISSPKEFLQKVRETLLLVPESNPQKVLADLGQRLNDDPNTYSVSRVSYFELGVIDYWKLLGSIILRRLGEPPLTQKSLRKLLEQNKNLLHNPKNHIALEFAFNEPQHWIGIQVSTEENNEYVLDFDTLIQLIKLA